VKRLFARFMPTDPAALARLPFLGSMASRVADRQLWRLRRQTVAIGLAVGAFFAFAIPFAQIPLAVVFAVWLRANVPTAVAATFVNTPLTFGPVYYAAYLVGNALLGRSPSANAEAVANVVSEGFGSAAADVVIGVLVGALVFACAAAIIGYCVVQATWALRVRLRARRSAGLRDRTKQG
jgi:uncharacterized protein (DUF2062 family)